MRKFQRALHSNDTWYRRNLELLRSALWYLLRDNPQRAALYLRDFAQLEENRKQERASFLAQHPDLSDHPPRTWQKGLKLTKQLRVVIQEKYQSSELHNDLTVMYRQRGMASVMAYVKEHEG